MIPGVLLTWPLTLLSSGRLQRECHFYEFFGNCGLKVPRFFYGHAYDASHRDGLILMAHVPGRTEPMLPGLRPAQVEAVFRELARVHVASWRSTDWLDKFGAPLDSVVNFADSCWQVAQQLRDIQPDFGPLLDRMQPFYTRSYYDKCFYTTTSELGEVRGTFRAGRANYGSHHFSIIFLVFCPELPLFRPSALRGARGPLVEQHPVGDRAGRRAQRRAGRHRGLADQPRGQPGRGLWPAARAEHAHQVQEGALAAPAPPLLGGGQGGPARGAVQPAAGGPSERRLGTGRGGLARHVHLQPLQIRFTLAFQLEQAYEQSLPQVCVVASFGAPLYYRMESVTGGPRQAALRRELLDRVRALFEDTLALHGL